MLILIRSMLIALNQASEIGNYTVMRDLAAPEFSAADPAARLTEIFASQRAQHPDLSGGQCSTRSSPCCRRSRPTG